MCVDSRAGLIFINKRISRKVARTKRVIIMSYIQCVPSLSFYFILFFFRSLVLLRARGPLYIIFLSINSFSQPSGPRPLRERFSVLFFKHTHPVAAAAPSHARDLSNVLPGKNETKTTHQRRYMQQPERDPSATGWLLLRLCV
jgi:hypothetical protein